ncbi:MAG: hypothetical protein WD058_08380 [Dehalococcoidia bacterium]
MSDVQQDHGSPDRPVRAAVDSGRCEELRAALEAAKSSLAVEMHRTPGVPGGGIDAGHHPSAAIQQEIRALEAALREAGCE